jgi:branched-chain amino acid transport system substrate-binding protein
MQQFVVAMEEGEAMAKKWVLSGVGVLLVVFLLGLTPTVEGGQKQTVKIAFIGPLTGGNAAVGKGAKNSFELKVNELLAKGDYPYTIQIVNEDDASDPATGVAAATKVGSDPDVVAAATHWNSPVGLATVHVFNKFGLAQLFWGTIHADIIYGNNYKGKVRLIPTSKDSNDLAGEYAKKLSRLSWAIVHDTTDYGTKNRDEFKGAIEAQGGKILGAFGVTVGQQDFSAVLSKVRELKPEGIYYGGVVTEGAGVRKQANKLGLTRVMFMGPPGIQSDTFGQLTGADGEAAFCSGTFDVNSSAQGRAFVKAYNAKYPTEPFEQNGPYAYDSAAIILEALKAVGPDRAKIIDYIRGHEFKGVIGDIKWDSAGQNRRGGLTMYINQGGKWVKFEESVYASGKRKLPWQ